MTCWSQIEDDRQNTMEALMFYSSSPKDLYEEYQVRVDKAVRNYQQTARMQPLARTTKPAPLKLRAWLSTFRKRLERQQQPVEEGSVA